MSETWVKAWVFYVAVGILISTTTGAVIFYMENQRTQSLLDKIATDFETKMVTLQTNQSIALTQLASDFNTKIAAANAQIESLATSKGALEQEKITLTTNLNNLQSNYNVIKGRENNITRYTNNTWMNFTLLFNKGLKKLNDTRNILPQAQNYFSIAWSLFALNDTQNYTRAKQNATLSKTKYSQVWNLFNASNKAFTSARENVSENWTVNFTTKYLNLFSQAFNMSYEMLQTNWYLINASDYFLVGNLSNWHITKDIMRNHWNCYNVSFSAYINQTKSINTFLNSL